MQIYKKDQGVGAPSERDTSPPGARNLNLPLRSMPSAPAALEQFAAQRRTNGSPRIDEESGESGVRGLQVSYAGTSEASEAPEIPEARPVPTARHPLEWERALGTVPFSKVWLAEDPHLGSSSHSDVYLLHTDSKEVPFIAAKVMHPGFESETDAEVDGWEILQSKTQPHEGVVTTFGVAEVPTPKGLERATLQAAVYPSVDADDVFRGLHALHSGADIEDPISDEQFDGAAGTFTRLMAMGVAHINSAGMKHGDPAPDNFRVSVATGLPKLTDLGCWSDDQNRYGGGHPHYHPPEYQEEMGFDPKYDAHAFGVMLRDSLYGGRPRPVVEGKWYTLLAQALLNKDPEQRPTLEEALASPLFPSRRSAQDEARDIAVLQRAARFAWDHPNTARATDPSGDSDDDEEPPASHPPSRSGASDEDR
jgi:serine/threonine protein kinase